MSSLITVIPPFAWKVSLSPTLGASSSPWHCSVQLLRALRHQGLRPAARSHVALVTVVEWHQVMQVLQHAQVGVLQQQGDIRNGKIQVEKNTIFQKHTSM